MCNLCIIPFSQGPQNEAAQQTPFTCLLITYSNVCVHKQTISCRFIFSLSYISSCFSLQARISESTYCWKHFLSRSLLSSSLLLSPPCHLVSALLLFVPWFHCSVLQFQHFNISSNISRAESSVAELFSTTGNLGEEKSGTPTQTHTHTLIHTILIQRWIHTVDLWLWVWIFASEKCKKVILELWPGKERGRSIRGADPTLL